MDAEVNYTEFNCLVAPAWGFLNEQLFGVEKGEIWSGVVVEGLEEVFCRKKMPSAKAGCHVIVPMVR